MIWVALAAVTLNALTVAAFAGVIRSLLRQSARERDLLTNQLMHLAGRTWQQPPTVLVEREDPAERFTPSPEQYEIV